MYRYDPAKLKRKLKYLIKAYGIGDALAEKILNAVDKSVEVVIDLRDEVLYVCDRTACPECNPDCYHTSDIEHAVNFKKQESSINPGTYEFWEESDVST